MNNYTFDFDEFEALDRLYPDDDPDPADELDEMFNIDVNDFENDRNVNIAQLSFAIDDIVKDMENNGEISDEFESTKHVLKSGNPYAKLMVIGRDLGQEELATEAVLIGVSGQILRTTLHDAGLDVDEDVYLTNLVPFKPKMNKAFSPQIVNKFSWILDSQIQIVKPRIIITLGKEASDFVLSA